MSLRASIANFVIRHMVKRHMDRVTDIESLRRRMDATPVNDTVPEGFALERETLSDVPCEWISGPDSRPERVLLYLHGGCYIVGTPAHYRDLAARLCGETGMRVLVPDYRLAPTHPFPAAVDDASAVYRHLLDSGIAPEAIAVAGDSAGGGLTLAMLSAMRRRATHAGSVCPDLALDGPDTIGPQYRNKCKGGSHADTGCASAGRVCLHWQPGCECDPGVAALC